ncbi:MAG: acetamidase/formamidase family protein [Gammaproteobacteria bacterium]|nr:acetamidase/formamidase family protein [Gammaproteobacteria bacterium]
MFVTPTSRSFRRAAAFALCIPLALAACQAAPPLEEQSAEAPPAAETPAPEYTLGPENSHNRWSSTIPPQLTVPSGAVVEVFTKEASDGQITESTTAEDLANVDFDLIHALTGPIYVEGASPGDILAVTLHEIEVQGWGWAGIFPGFGFLADEITGPWIRGFPMEPGATEVAFNDDITIPLAPFAGVMGVAPDTDSMLVTIPPRTNGGNMDNRHMIAGTTVYFPVQVEGALFSIGDAHAAQGDGEVSGSAIETPVRVVFEVEVMENTRGMVEPQYESDDYYAVTGFATTIDEAARKATRYMIDYLVAEHGLTREEAYVLCSIAGDMKISETVDVPHLLVSMHMPKGIF